MFPIFSKASFVPVMLACAMVSAAQVAGQVSKTGDFETGDLSQFKIQGAREDSLTCVTSPRRAGRYAGRSLLRSSDPDTANGKRAEFVDHTVVPLNQICWYGLSIFADDTFTVPKSADGICFQFHQNARTGSPVLAFRLIDDNWRITTDATSKRRTLAVVPFEKKKWTDWVIRVKWSGETSGQWTIWKDGVQIVHEANVVTTLAAETAGPYAKFGQYHTVSEVAENVLFFDEYRMGGPNSAYVEISPGGVEAKTSEKDHPAPAP